MVSDYTLLRGVLSAFISMVQHDVVGSTGWVEGPFQEEWFIAVGLSHGEYRRQEAE